MALPTAERGGLALQPHRRARPRPLPSGRSTTTDGRRRRRVPSTATGATSTRRDGPRRCSTSSTRRSAAPIDAADPGGHGRDRADRRHPHVGGDGDAIFPRLVIDAGENSEVTVVERFRSADGATTLRSSCPACTCGPARPPGSRYLAINELGATVWQLGHQQAVGERDSTTLLATVALGGDYARVRTDAQVVGQGATHAPGRPVLRRRHADARLPHHAGPRRPAHDQRPAVQGRGAGPRPQRVHRPDPHRPARPRARSPSRPTATSRSARAPGPRACRTSRSRPTT